MDSNDRNCEWEIKDSTPEDRIKARRLRIDNRIKAAQKLHKLIKAQHVFGHTQKTGEDNEELPPVKTQCENSKTIIDELIENGTELVSNVQLASEHLHVQHCQRVEERLKSLHAIINKEDEEANIIFAEIKSKWLKSKKIPIGAPTELYHKIMEQNKACNELLGKRNDLIELLESEILDSDDQYKMLIGEFHENIEVLSSRMEQQVQTLEKVIMLEWNRMEKVFEKQREVQLKRKDFAWNVKSETLNRTSQEKLEDRLNILVTQQNEIDKIITEDAEIYAGLKMETEESIASLTDQIHMLDAIHQLNEEKLDYEIHVLRKHEEENVHVKSEQKRKIASLQDSFNKIKIKIQDRKIKTKNEESSLVSYIAQSQNVQKELNGKRQNLINQFHKKKQDIVKITRAELLSNLENISQMDYLLSKLFGPYCKPSKIDIKDTDYGMCPNTSRSISSASSHSSALRNSVGGEIIHVFHTEIKDEAFKTMLANLVQEAHFLVEENLGYLIDTISEDERNLFKLDSILNVLGVECEEEILGVLRKATSVEQSLSATYSDLLKILRQYVDSHHEKTISDKTKIIPENIKKSRVDIIKSKDSVGKEIDLQNIQQIIELLNSSKNLNLKFSLNEYLNILKERSMIRKNNLSLSRVNQELKEILERAHII
nr:dynein regulatory complex protein 1-like [Lepeophtheirus salmonis]